MRLTSHPPVQPRPHDHDRACAAANQPEPRGLTQRRAPEPPSKRGTSPGISFTPAMRWSTCTIPGHAMSLRCAGVTVPTPEKRENAKYCIRVRGETFWRRRSLGLLCWCRDDREDGAYPHCGAMDLTNLNPLS